MNDIILTRYLDKFLILVTKGDNDNILIFKSTISDINKPLSLKLIANIYDTIEPVEILFYKDVYYIVANSSHTKEPYMSIYSLTKRKDTKYSLDYIEKQIAIHHNTIALSAFINEDRFYITKKSLVKKKVITQFYELTKKLTFLSWFELPYSY